MYNFPDTPALNSVVTTASGSSYVWDGTKWAAGSGYAGLTANALIKGGGAGAAPVASTATVDGSGNLTVTGTLSSGTHTVAGATNSGGYQVRPGTPGPGRGNYFNIDWTGSVAQVWIDAANLGTIAFTSDYRIKENVEALPRTWEQLKALRPVSYNIKDTEDGLFRRDHAERWGFIAHELQETLIPSAATGYKDAPNLVQSPDMMTLLATTVRTLQEAMARIEALEARGAPAGD